MISGFRGAVLALGGSACVALACAPAAEAAVFVGSYRVDQGPSWFNSPRVYSATEAAALLFGGQPGDYDISTVGTNPANINNLGWYSVWGVAGGTTFAEDYSLDLGAPGYNVPGGAGSAISAYVDDNALGPQYTNFVFRVSSSAVPEPGTWLMMIAGLATLGAALRRAPHRARADASIRFA